MNRNLVASAALIASTVLVPAAAAMAQSREAEIRFENAQRRFDGELAIFKAEAERYERSKLVPSTPIAAPAPVAAEAPPPRRADPVRDMDDEPRPGDLAPSAEPDEREPR